MCILICTIRLHSQINCLFIYLCKVFCAKIQLQTLFVFIDVVTTMMYLSKFGHIFKNLNVLVASIYWWIRLYTYDMPKWYGM